MSDHEELRADNARLRATVERCDAFERQLTAEVEALTAERAVLREELAETRRLLEVERIDATELREYMRAASPCENGERGEHCSQCDWNDSEVCVVDGEAL